jgi:hypothetical protein
MPGLKKAREGRMRWTGAVGGWVPVDAPEVAVETELTDADAALKKLEDDAGEKDPE